jgi:hypothetical protein
MVNFSYELRDLDEHGIELILIGYMDEQTVLPEIKRLQNCQRLIVNFGRVNAILSMGVKEWVIFSDQLEKLPHLKVEFRNCSKQVIDQINLVQGFLPKNGVISTLFVPVFCNQCSRTFKVLRKADNIGVEINQVIPSMEVPDCSEFPACKETYELDCNPNFYLKFLKKPDA